MSGHSREGAGIEPTSDRPSAENDALARVRALAEHWLWYAQKCETEGHTPRMMFAAAGRRVLAEIEEATRDIPPEVGDES